MEKKSVMKKITGSREALLAVVLIVLFVIITAINPSFLTPKSLMDMLKNNAVTMVMSLGMLCVMLVGGIDISIMSTLALSGMSIGMLLKYEHISSTFPVSYTHLDVYKRQVHKFSSGRTEYTTCFVKSIQLNLQFAVFPPVICVKECDILSVSCLLYTSVSKEKLRTAPLRAVS